jgi:hypothetical protein
VLLVGAVGSECAHGAGGGVDDGAAPVRALAVRRVAAVQVAFGEQLSDHALDGRQVLGAFGTAGRAEVKTSPWTGSPDVREVPRRLPVPL